MAVQKVKAKKQAQFALPMVEKQLVLPLLLTIVGKENFTGARNDTVNFKLKDEFHGVQLDGGGTAGADEHGGAAGGQPDAQGQERRRPLVVVDVEAHPGLGGKGEGQRCRA